MEGIKMNFKFKRYEIMEMKPFSAETATKCAKSAVRIVQGGLSRRAAIKAKAALQKKSGGDAKYYIVEA